MDVNAQIGRSPIRCPPHTPTPSRTSAVVRRALGCGVVLEGVCECV